MVNIYTSNTLINVMKVVEVMNNEIIPSFQIQRPETGTKESTFIGLEAFPESRIH